MRWLFSSLTLCRRSAQPSRKAPKRKRSWALEGLERRGLLSLAIEPVATLPGSLSNIVSGPGGDLWVPVSPDYNVAAIEKVGLDGSVTTFPVAGENEAMNIDSLVTGPDGNLWFDITFSNESTGGSHVVIGTMTPGGAVTEFPSVPLPSGLNWGTAGTMVSGPGGDLWFPYVLGNSRQKHQDFIGRVTTAGAVTLFPIDSFNLKSPGWFSIAAGADGNIWFAGTVGENTTLGQMSPSGVMTMLPSINKLDAGTLATGPNGSLILTGRNLRQRHEVLDVSASGAITRYKIPAAISSSFATYLGQADGSLWFANGFGAIEIGQINASGSATSTTLASATLTDRNDVESMTIGQDGDPYMLDDVASGGTSTAVVYRVSTS